MVKKRHRSDRSKLRDVRRELADFVVAHETVSLVLDYTRETLDKVIKRSREAIDDVVNQRDRLSLKVHDAETDLANLRTAYRMLASEQDELRAVNTLLLSRLKQDTIHLRELRSYAILMSTLVVDKLRMVEAIEHLPKLAAELGMNPDDIRTAAKEVLPEAYRLTAEMLTSQAVASLR